MILSATEILALECGLTGVVSSGGRPSIGRTSEEAIGDKPFMERGPAGLLCAKLCRGRTPEEPMGGKPFMERGPAGLFCAKLCRGRTPEEAIGDKPSIELGPAELLGDKLFMG